MATLLIGNRNFKEPKLISLQPINFEPDVDSVNKFCSVLTFCEIFNRTPSPKSWYWMKYPIAHYLLYLHSIPSTVMNTE